jgi:hypothetical protein
MLLAGTLQSLQRHAQHASACYEELFVTVGVMQQRHAYVQCKATTRRKGCLEA